MAQKSGHNIYKVEPTDFHWCNLFGSRLVANGLITLAQREEIIRKQAEYRERGVIVRLGELAVIEGYCTRAQIESMPGFIGDSMVAVGIITVAQRDQVLLNQREYAKAGINLRFGDILVKEGYTTREEVELVAARQEKRAFA